MRAAYSPRLVVVACVLFCALVAGCGKARSRHVSGGASATTPLPAVHGGVASVATKNTTRLGGTDPVADAAAVAQAVYPGLTAAGHPRAAVIVDERDWPASLAASELAAAPLGAPLLYAEGDVLPEASALALRALRPVGSPALGGAQVIRIATSAAVPEGLRTREVAAGASAASTAAAVEGILRMALPSPPRAVIVLAAEAPLALQMPAAGLSAESGAPILFVTATGVPPATAAVLHSLKRPAIYLVAPAAIPGATRAALAHLGPVTAIEPTTTPGGGEAAVQNAIAVARFTDGTFGWGVKEPGHGLAFANTGRPLDAPAAAPLSASGDYAPLLLVEDPLRFPSPLRSYLADLQPGYGSAPQFQPVHGSYNHGWLIGDERAISALTQAGIDSLLEIVPRKQPSEPSIAPVE